MFFNLKVSWYRLFGGFDFREVDRWEYNGLIYMLTVVYRCKKTGIEKRTVDMGDISVGSHEHVTFFHKKYEGTRHLALVRAMAMKGNSSYLVIWDKNKIMY